MPATSADALVVGGGVLGAATAWYLAGAGVDTMLVERGELGAASSGANAGSLHAQIQHATYVQRGEDWARSFAPATRFLVESIEVWEGLGDELGAELEVSLPGGLLVARTADQMRSIERKVAIEREQGLASEMLSASDLRDVAPYVAPDMVGGELCPQEGKANPLLATAALARGATRQGARVLPRTTLCALESAPGGGFLARTSAGAIRCRRVLLCAGVDTAAVAAMVGASVGVGAMALQAAVTETIAPLVTHLLYYAGGPLTLKQARAGSVLIGGGWAAGGRAGAPRVDSDGLLGNLALARRVVPAIAGARLLRTWTGLVNTTDSWLPVVGELAPGVFVGAFPFMGFTAGPLLGRTLAELATGRSPSVDVSTFLPR